MPWSISPKIIVDAVSTNTINGTNMYKIILIETEQS